MSDVGHPCPRVLREVLPVPAAPILGDSLENDVLIGYLEPLLIDPLPGRSERVAAAGGIVLALVRPTRTSLYFGHRIPKTHYIR